MNTLRKKKIKELQDLESRQFFYEEHIETGLPFQIRELRKKRKLTQVKLAEIIGCDQSNISDWENPDYAYTPQISTLKRLANAFDVPLIVRFGSWKELFEYEENLNNETLAPKTFDDEFKDVDLSNVEENNLENKSASNIVDFPTKVTSTIAVNTPQFEFQPKFWLEDASAPPQTASEKPKVFVSKNIPTDSWDALNKIKVKKAS